MHKLDNPVRIEELNPKETLKKIGHKEGRVLCDIGAGTGIFTFAAAELATSDVYAVDISAERRGILEERRLGRQNVKIVSAIEEVPSQSCDLALLCAVLHELDDISGMMQEIHRVLRLKGQLAVIEFHKEHSPMGPPAEMRISEQDTRMLLIEQGFALNNRWVLGENYYCLTFDSTQED